MKHKWDSIITKKKRYKTCINCGTVFETGYPSHYFRPYTDEPFFRAGDCETIANKAKKLNEVSGAKRIQP